jgi:uncharacterized protein YggE
MKLASALAIAILTFFSTAHGALADDSSTLTVSGQSAISRSPDLALVDVALISSDDGAAAKATEANNVAYNHLRDRLHALGLRDEALKTTSFSVQYRPHPPQERRPLNAAPVVPAPGDRYGYVATRIVSITAPRVDAAGTVVDAAVAVGANVNGVRYTLADPHAATAQALAAAVADAQSQAKAVADAAHMHIAGIKSIDVNGSPMPVAFARAAMASDAGPVVPTQLQPNALEVRASVSVTYTLAP